MNEEMFLGVNGKLLINDFKPSYTITMNHSDGECVGRFDFNGPKLIFTGDAEESAKVFVNYLAMIWEKRLQEEREAEREACAKENAELLQALQNLHQRCHWADAPEEMDAAKAAIEKAIRARGEV